MESATARPLLRHRARAASLQPHRGSLGGPYVLGDGYTAGAIARIGVADLQPNAELLITRDNGRSQLQATAYRRLDAANDWGNPLGLGASATALLFGRDEGFYYRTLGVEVKGAHSRAIDGPVLSWRLFAEHHDSASVETQRSLANLVNGSRFVANIAAREGTFAGGATSLGLGWGVDPRGARFSGTVHAELAGGETSYGRASAELSVRGLGSRLQATVTGGAGSSVGALPPQRMWYLGGAHTVHGYSAGSAAGDAFWMGRAELARGSPVIRGR